MAGHTIRTLRNTLDDMANYIGPMAAITLDVEGTIVPLYLGAVTQRARNVVIAVPVYSSEKSLDQHADEAIALVS